ncbi:MAG TPA: FAD-dependent oxidoreductase [Gemmatimonadales bacterium]|nr:FAD-dependent oxidoreductase [Gemmatimonadales bacterium]
MIATRAALAAPGALFAALKPPLGDSLAMVEADRCLECGGPAAPAPCVAACPAGIDVPGFIHAITLGDAIAAAETIFAENLLGGSCARVCPAEELCEGACVLDKEGRRPVEIARLQRYAIDRAFARGVKVRTPAAPNGRRVAVIGAGPAGLVCAGELAILGYAVTVYDARPDYGGLIRYAIAPYRQVREPLPEEVARIASLGVELRMGLAVDSPARLRNVEREVDAVFLGVGLGDDVGVRYPGDALPGVWNSLPFIEAIKLGRSPRVGARVVVIGGGNTAIDVAREALRLGAGEVTIVYRRGEAEMPAYPHEVAEARAEGVQFRWLTNPLRFLGNGRLDRVECQRMQLGPPDQGGRRRPEPVPASEFVLFADTAVKALGQQRRTELLGWIEGLETDRGLIVIDAATGQSTHPKYFAGGDAVNGGDTVVAAVRSAKIAARGIHRYLSGAGAVA